MPVDRMQEVKDVCELIAAEEITEEEGLQMLIDKGYSETYAKDQMGRAGFGEFE